jgi:DNA-binding FadR family transcriptional regulator
MRSLAPNPNVAERIERDLTRAILRGDHRPGSRLPTLRELAVEYGVNPSTMQRALARLEARGLITARQGSGLRVNDPHDVADLTLLADWLAVTVDDPERAANLIEELAEVRRILAVRLLVRHRQRILDLMPELITHVATLRTPSGDLSWRASIEVEKRIVRATGNSMVVTLLNSMARALEEHPLLVEAMFGDGDRSADGLLVFVDVIREGGDAMAERLEAIMAAGDAETARRFRRLLEEQAKKAGAA